MKKVMVLGVGAQGSIIARRLMEEDKVEEVICADYDQKAAEESAKFSPKGKALQIDARNVNDIVKAAKGCELIVNGLPPDFNMIVMDACLEVKANYQDLASGPVEGMEFIPAVERQLGRTKEFEAAGLSALFNTGSAPGMANIITKEACELFDAVDTITICVYDGMWSEKFIPFWWSPETAFGDMAAECIVYENKQFKKVPPFNNPEYMEFKGLGERLMFDHEHEEPVTMGLLGDKYLKGVSNIYFRYGGPGCELARYFWKMGLLSEEAVEVKGQKIVPMDLISKLTPPAPKYEDEIKAVLEEGMISEEGAFLVRVDGQSEGRKTRVDAYFMAPGLQESFELAGVTHETYGTGQCAFLFSKMLVNGKVRAKGVFPPEALDAEERRYFFDEAEKLKLFVEFNVEYQL